MRLGWRRWIAVGFLFFVPVAGAESKSDLPTVLVLLNLSNNVDDTARLGREGVRIALAASHGEGDKVAHFKIFDIEENVALAAKQLIQEVDRARPAAIIGILRSDLAFSIAEVAEARKIPFITPMATHPKLTEGRRYVFRSCFDDNRQASLLARFVHDKRKLHTGAILYNSGFSFSLGFEAAFRKAFESLGGTIVQARAFASEAELDAGFLQSLKALKPQFVLMPSYQLEAASLLTRLSKVLPKATEYFGPDSWGGGAFFDAAVSGPVRDVTAFYSDHWSREDNRPANRVFLKAFDRYPPETPDLRTHDSSKLAYVASFYELTGFMIEVFKQKEPGEALVDAIRKTVYEGPRGRISFGSSNSTANPLRIFQVVPGSDRFVMTFGGEEASRDGR